MARCAEASVVVDVGAEYGFYTDLALRCRPGGLRVIAFEPEADRFASLRQRFHGHECVVLHPVALSNRADIVEARRPGAEWSLSIAWPNHGEMRQLVETVVFDDLYPNTAVDVVKIDVEGAEALVLAGMRQLLARARPTLFIEFHAPRGNAATLDRLQDRDRLAQVLDSVGYRVDNTCKDGGRTVLRPV